MLVCCCQAGMEDILKAPIGKLEVRYAAAPDNTLSYALSQSSTWEEEVIDQSFIGSPEQADTFKEAIRGLDTQSYGALRALVAGVGEDYRVVFFYDLAKTNLTSEEIRHIIYIILKLNSWDPNLMQAICHHPDRVTAWQQAKFFLLKKTLLSSDEQRLLDVLIAAITT